MFEAMLMCRWQRVVLEWLNCCKTQANGDGQRRPSCVKVPVIVAEGYGHRIGILLLVTLTSSFYNGMGMHLKKICEGFPCFLDFKILKVPFWATWGSGGVGISIVVVPIVAVIVVVDLVSKERGAMQKAKVSNGRQKMNMAWKGRVIVWSFVRSFVRLSPWKKEKDNLEAKKWWRGKEGAKVKDGQKKSS
jgi:hypothetical protein